MVRLGMRALKTVLLVAAGAAVCWGTLTYGPRVWGSEGSDERRIGVEDVRDSARKCADAVARVAERTRDACDEVTSRFAGEGTPKADPSTGSGQGGPAKAGTAEEKEAKAPKTAKKDGGEEPLSLPEMSDRLSEMISLAKKFNAKVAEATREAPPERAKKH